VFHCVAERRRAQTALAAAHAQAVSDKNRLDAVMESLPVGVAILDSKGGSVRSNNAFDELWGKPRPQAREVHDYAKFKAWWPDSGRPVQPEEWASAQAVQQGRTVVGQLMRIETFDGAQRFIQNSAAPIRDAESEIVGCVVAIDDVTELERAELELRRSNEDLSQFAFAISHDLRSPLNAVSSYAKQIAEEYGGKLGSEADVYLSYLTSATDRMRRLISDLLAYSRVAGDSGGKGASISSDEALRSAELNLQGRIHETRAVITHDPLPDVVGSSTLLALLFQNLLENAMKFRGEEAPHIHVSVERGDQEWGFCVSDNGIGIDPKRIEQVFLIFKRLHGDRYEGTGIGLAICRKIVERHGGRIWADSGPGTGSRFYFTLPVRAVVGAQPSAR
jgi:PAS domain S-box-containing protein